MVLIDLSGCLTFFNRQMNPAVEFYGIEDVDVTKPAGRRIADSAALFSEKSHQEVDQITVSHWTGTPERIVETGLSPEPRGRIFLALPAVARHNRCVGDEGDQRRWPSDALGLDAQRHDSRHRRNLNGVDGRPRGVLRETERAVDSVDKHLDVVGECTEHQGFLRQKTIARG